MAHWAVTILVSLPLGVALAAVYIFMKKKAFQQEAQLIISRAQNEAQKMEKEARIRLKDMETRLRQQLQEESAKIKQNLRQKELELQQKEKALMQTQQDQEKLWQKKWEELSQKESHLKQMESHWRDQHQRLELERERLQRQIQQVAQMSQDEARRELMEALRQEASQSIQAEVDEMEKAFYQQMELRAQLALATAMSRLAHDFVSEKTVTVVNLKSEDLKGKIIGREGRNIRALEAACGVDIIVDEAPEVVVISAFDPLRRELARASLEKLLEDGRVHPARIEDVVEKEREELQRRIREVGEQAAKSLDVGPISTELARYLGTLKWRLSQAQNLLDHSLEVAHLAGLLAQELGQDVRLAKRAGLLHDIGKAVDHTVEGPHWEVGAQLLKRVGEDGRVVQAVLCHHEKPAPSDLLGWIVLVANQLSHHRPGARRAGLDQYFRRHQELENIANRFDGVIRSFAVQGGHEVRVFVEASLVDEQSARQLARDILRRCQEQLPHVSPLKINVIRELRSVEWIRT